MARHSAFSVTAGLVCLLLLPSTASARLCVDDVSLGFGASYSVGDAQRTHRGVDIAMDAGSSVLAPEAGTVRFAGRVPGSDGGTVLAVTIATDSGSVSLLPLARTSVRVGESVERDAVVGELAESGDRSSPAPHLHFGLRRGDLYIDPSVLLAATSPQRTREPEPREPPTEVSVAPAPAPAAAPANAPVPSEPPVIAEVPSPLAVLEPAAAVTVVPGEGAAAAEPSPAPPVTNSGVNGFTPLVRPRSILSMPLRQSVQSMGLRTSRGAVTHAAAPACASPLAAGVTLAAASAREPGTTNAQTGAVGSLPEAVASAGRRVETAATSLLFSAGSEAVALLAVGALAVGAAYVLLLRRRALERQIKGESPVSDRLGRLLQQLRAGDTLCGLTSCSGHAAFTVPEPSSPGEVTK